MRTILILAAGVAVGYNLQNNKDESIEYLVGKAVENAQDAFKKVRSLFSAARPSA